MSEELTSIDLIFKCLVVARSVNAREIRYRRFEGNNAMQIHSYCFPCRLFGDEFEYRFWKVALHFMTLERLRISKSPYRVSCECHC